MEEIKLNIDVKNNEVIVRTGQAPQINEPVKYSVTGSAGSVTNYLEHRAAELDITKVVIELNEDKGSITVRRNPNDSTADVIIGAFQEYPHLTKFGINADKKFSRESLVKLIKFNRIFFDTEAFTSLLLQLNDFSAKVQASLNQSSDNRGNKGTTFNKNVDADVALGFKLTMPIFKGFVPKSFFVDIAFDISDNGVQFWFESVELAELKLEAVNDAFRDFKESFQQYVIIEQ